MTARWTRKGVYILPDPHPKCLITLEKKTENVGNHSWRKGWVGSWGGMTQNHSNEYFRVTLTLKKAQGATKGIYNLLCCTWLQEVLLPWNTSPPPSRRGIKDINSAWSRDGTDILEFKDKKLDFFHLYWSSTCWASWSHPLGTSWWLQKRVAALGCLALHFSVTWPSYSTK